MDTYVRPRTEHDPYFSNCTELFSSQQTAIDLLTDSAIQRLQWCAQTRCSGGALNLSQLRATWLQAFTTSSGEANGRATLSRAVAGGETWWELSRSTVGIIDNGYIRCVHGRRGIIAGTIILIFIILIFIILIFETHARRSPCSRA